MTIKISIHSPRVGRDESAPTSLDIYNTFQSTLPAWGETISNVVVDSSCPNFNPLSPRGERQDLPMLILPIKKFQSTLPAWGETLTTEEKLHYIIISIHSPRVGRDIVMLPSYIFAYLISIHSPRVGRDINTPGAS